MKDNLMNEVSVLCLLMPWFFIVLIKVYALTFHNIIHNLRIGITISQVFRLKAEEGIELALSYLSEQKYTTSRVFQELYKKCTNKLIMLLFAFFYKWPVMVTISATLLYYFAWLQYILVSVILSIACIVLITIELAHEIVARLTLGNVDNFKRYVVLDPTELNSLKNVFYDKNKILRDFISTILVQLACFSWAFSSIYFCMSQFDSSAFNQKLNTPIDAIYFAVVVAGTIGFGDIVPLIQISKLLVIYNIVIITIFVVFIVGHFFATLSDTPENILRPKP